MGVLQDIGVRVRSLLYDRAERFIAAEDSRRTEGLSERFQKKFVEFYEDRHLGDRGYEGYADYNARMLFSFYDRFGEKGLELIGFYDGVKLRSRDILNMRNFVEHCELIENSDKGLNRGINLAARLVDEFSLKEIVRKLSRLQDPEIAFVLGLRHQLEKLDKQREADESRNSPEVEMLEDEMFENFEADDATKDGREQVSDVDRLIAGAKVRSKATEAGMSMTLDRELG